MMDFIRTGMEVQNQSDQFLKFLYAANGKRVRSKMAVFNRTDAAKPKIFNTRNPSNMSPCTSTGERRCEDGSCIPRVDLCPEEQLMNQNTILIMIVVGLAVVVFLIILYCFQQRQRRTNRELGGDTGLTDDCDNASLYAPPPTYDDVINSNNLYPATPEQRRLRQLANDDEPVSPMTPPPNYDTALIILAASQDSVFRKPRRNSSLYRRSVSLEQVNRRSESPSDQDNESQSKVKTTKRTRNIFRFSRQWSRASNTSNVSQQCHSPSIVPHSPPPYPQTPPVYPLTPPPPFTPTYHPPSFQSQTDSSSQDPTTGRTVIS